MEEEGVGGLFVKSDNDVTVLETEIVAQLGESRDGEQKGVRLGREELLEASRHCRRVRKAC